MRRAIDTCPSCDGTVTSIQVPPGQWPIAEPCGHDVAVIMHDDRVQLEQACLHTLTWDRQRHGAHGRPHEHRCKLRKEHPVSDGSGVQVHECGVCTIAWESDWRPIKACKCSAGRNPLCPVHGDRR